MKTQATLKRTVLLFWMAAAVYQPVGESLGASTTTLSSDAHSALQFYLGQDCAVEEEPRALRKVVSLNVRHHGVIEPVLINYLSNGPDEDAIATAQRVLEDQWKRHEESLKNQPSMKMAEQQIRALKAITKDAFMRDGLTRFTKQYREKSAVALAEIGTTQAQQALAEAKKTGDSELRNAIKAATERRKSIAPAAPAAIERR